MAFARNGYGQVEPTQLSAQKTGQIYASLPLDTNVTTLQNGEFMYYDYAAGKVTGTATQYSSTTIEPMLVFNEVKLYESWHSYKDFAMIRVGENYVTSADAATRASVDESGYNVTSASISHSGDAQYRLSGIYPRLFKTNVGDIMVTNMVGTGDSVTYTVGTVLAPKLNSSSHTLVLDEDSTTVGASDMKWVVVKIMTLADGQAALKLQRIA